ncbi:imidazole glycerol phosphate synthase subunit HisH [Streptomyces sp. ST2-7A]|uniref:imidazole glycerol phosphate synthase subunit HisH n=1 Tax=Streptomyces sp. ST2-7A TaxID=2907214 RepID=UPI001F2322AC|nr:imidazole glycerol phosphate synthase subunit HisH [Streptomyces sp. ST2-7A]MCE7082000.1 imidazole glycerol phosphate synthase subunit HisH [Streptomyces sp. ST2-7A]
MTTDPTGTTPAAASNTDPTGTATPTDPAPAGAAGTGRARKSVVVFDYGFGNVRSAQRALTRAGADVEITRDYDAALEADGLLVPGVGAFAACMAGLVEARGDWVVQRRLAGGRPVMGICVGMQILFGRGIEHGVETAGLDEWPGTVDRLRAEVVPHMGWNTVEAPEGSRLFAGLDPAERFYFVHSYAVHDWTMEIANPRMTPPLVTRAVHGGSFVAAVENGPLWATQFHPEKSGDAGARLLSNWIESL